MQQLGRKKKQLELLNEEDSSSYQTLQKEKQSSTADIKSRELLPYRKTSSHIKNRYKNKSISEAKFDVDKRRIVFGS